MSYNLEHDTQIDKMKNSTIMQTKDRMGQIHVNILQKRAERRFTSSENWFLSTVKLQHKTFLPLKQEESWGPEKDV